MATKVGAISIDLSANSARFSGDMRKASSALNSSQARMNRSLSRVDRGFRRMTKSVMRTVGSLFSLRGAFAGMIAAVGVGALGMLILRSIKTADAIGKLADRVGVGIEALQELTHAADLAGVSQEDLGKSLLILNRNISQAAMGMGEYVRIFDLAGVAVRDAGGNLRAAEDVFMDLADAIANAGDHTDKVNIAMTLLGRSGAGLLPLFKQGAAGVQTYREEAQRLGLVIGDKLVRSAEAANDELTRMKKIIGVNLTTLILGLTPTIIRLGEAFSELAPKIAAAIDKLLPAQFAGVERLDELIQALEEKIDDRKSGPLAAIRALVVGKDAVDLAISELEADLVVLVGLRDTAKKAEADAETALRNAKADEDAAAVESGVGIAQAVIDRLNDERLALGRTAFQQRAYTEIKKAGTGATTGQIAEIIALIDALRLQQNAAQQAANAETARQKAMAETAAFLQAEFDALNAEIVAQEAVIDRWKLTVEDALTSIIMRTKTAKDAFRQLALAIIEAGVRRYVVGGIIDAVFPASSAKALGGPMTAGTSYLVGERGPELFTPNIGGQLVPNSALGGGGGQVVYIDARGADVSVARKIRQELSAVNASIEERSINAVARDMSRGGPTSRVG